MSNIILVKPPLSKEEIYGEMSDVGAYDPPLGLAYLAANLKKNKIGVEIVDADAMRLSFDDVANFIAEKTPRYVGITAVTLDIYSAAQLAHKIKQRIKNITIILGGVHLTAVPRETMEKFTQFDIGIIGEGETTLLEVIQALNEKRDLNKIDGLVYRANGEIAFTQPRKMNYSLDSYPPPAWDSIPGFPQNYPVPPYSMHNSPSCSLVTSRGCGRRCTFCFQGTMGRTLRFHGAEYVLDIIKQLYYRYGIRDLRIVDDQFLAHRKRTEKICTMLIKENLNLTFSCLARIDTIDPQLLHLLKEAGCRQINFGIESGSQQILDLIKKDTKLEEIVQAVRWTKKEGIRTLGYFMLGLPTETESTIKESIAFAKKLLLDDISIFLLTPFPGTELHHSAHQYGTFKKDWKSMSLFIEPCFIPHGLTKEEILAYRKKALLQFYLRPRIIISYLRGITTISQIKALIKGVVTILRLLLTKGGSDNSQDHLS